MNRAKTHIGADPSERINIVKWTPKDAILKLAMCPNSVLEKFFMKKTYNAFGNRVAINPEWLEYFCLEINHRNQQGKVIFQNRMERRIARKHQPNLA